MAANPFVFVVGCPRSGTTLLQRMLDAHPQLTVANDTHFIPKALAKCNQDSNCRLTDDLVAAVRNYHRFCRLGLTDEAVERAAAASQTYVDFVSALYSEFAQSHQKPLAGDKTPDYVRCLPLLHRLFPRAKILHIIRDGRDVALSVLQWAKEDKGPGRLELWKEEPVGVCALWWKWQVNSGRKDAALLPPTYYCEVRYEDLVSTTEAVLGDIAEFLGLPYAPEMARYYEGKTRSEPGLSTKKAWLPPTVGLRDWRRDLDSRAQGLFESLAGDLLEELGYGCSAAVVSDEVIHAADRCRAWWKNHHSGRPEAHMAVAGHSS